MGAADLPRRPVADKFLHGAIVPAIAYQCTKFQLPSWISSGDMEGVLAYGFLYRTLVLVNIYNNAKFQHPSSNSFRDKEDVPKFNVGATTPCRTPYAETFMCAQSTWQGQTARQISASYLYASCSYANM